MCPGFATRTGVFPYLEASGKIVRELRHPDDVMDPQSLVTLKNAPITIEHPPQMINPTNVGKYSVGHTAERVEVNREFVDVDVIIEDQRGIDAVERDGIRELSSGYDADIVEESGVYNGAPYDRRQKAIRYNHVALVKRGRAGPEVRLRLDSADAVQQDDISIPTGAEFSQETAVNDADELGGGVKKVVILGREVDLPSDQADAVQDLLDRFDEMRAKQSILEEHMSKRRDEDVSKPTPSPQVKVEQQTPDGRKAPGKIPAKPGTITGPVGKADDEEENDDEDVHGVIGGEKPNSAAAGGKALEDEDMEDGEFPPKKEDDEPASGKGGGAMQAGIDQLRKDADEAKAKYDDAKAKMDEFAAASMNQPEKKPGEGKMDSADIEKRARQRAKLERQADKLVPASVSKRFDSMSDKEILAEVIKFRHPKADLADKSRTYLQSRFDSIVEAIAEEGTENRINAGKAFLGARMDADQAPADPSQARLKMISSTTELWKEPLRASKK